MSDNDDDSSLVPSWMDVEKEPVVDAGPAIPEEVFVYGNDDRSSDDDSDDGGIPFWMDVDQEMNIHVITPNEMLRKGLAVARYDEIMVNRSGEKKNIKRFKSTYGVSHCTMCKIYEDIQNRDLIDDSTVQPTPMYLDGKEINLGWFLRTVYFMRKYPTGDDMERELARNESWTRKKVWHMMKKIQFLKHKKIISILWRAIFLLVHFLTGRDLLYFDF